MGRNPQPLIDTFLRNEIPAWSRRFSESSHPDGYSFSYATSSIQLCAILFQRSPNHILTVELYFHRLIVIQINHAHKSIHTFFCQPANVRFLAGLLCQSANFFIQFIGTLLFLLFCSYAILQCSQFFRKSFFLFYVRIPQQYTVRIRFVQFDLL